MIEEEERPNPEGREMRKKPLKERKLLLVRKENPRMEVFILVTGKKMTTQETTRGSWKTHTLRIWESCSSSVWDVEELRTMNG